MAPAGHRSQRRVVEGDGGISLAVAAALKEIMAARGVVGSFASGGITPGETIDAVVTEEGIAVNPRRPELSERLAAAGLAPVSIEALRDKAARRAGEAARVGRATGAGRAEREGRARREGRAGTGRIVAVAEYRDGTAIDVIEGVKEGVDGEEA